MHAAPQIGSGGFLLCYYPQCGRRISISKVKPADGGSYGEGFRKFGYRKRHAKTLSGQADENAVASVSEGESTVEKVLTWLTLEHRFGMPQQRRCISARKLKACLQLTGRGLCQS
jgi:hypothetical protein